MRASPCLDLQLPIDERVALLMEDYDFFVKDRSHFCDRLDVLAEFRGKALVQEWKDKVHSGNVQPVVQDLLTQHYDPVYRQSMQRNFRQYPQARTIIPSDRSLESMRRLALQLLELP
jgi:tRNA 2-selenouridine synthase